ncbi:unnamed protein product [Timema podura]|uniref:Uncharacterized protein n=1 Tax=Timema podura TaxID=61482 RepID=A0ABN7P0T6_TIMPD|nr:unnamed protein product [Timema podura]
MYSCRCKGDKRFNKMYACRCKGDYVRQELSTAFRSDGPNDSRCDDAGNSCNGPGDSSHGTSKVNPEVHIA